MGKFNLIAAIYNKRRFRKRRMQKIIFGKKKTWPPNTCRSYESKTLSFLENKSVQKFNNFELSTSSPSVARCSDWVLFFSYAALSNGKRNWTIIDM